MVTVPESHGEANSKKASAKTAMVSGSGTSPLWIMARWSIFRKSGHRFSAENATT
jgi:hypothetical protein